MSDPHTQQPGQTPADYDEYGDEPQQDKQGEQEGGQEPLSPDQALTDPA